MKRLSVRLSIIGVLMASGILAIAQAQRGGGGDQNSAPTPLTGPGVASATTGAVGDSAPRQPQPLPESGALAPAGVGQMSVTPGYGPDPTPLSPQGEAPRATTSAQMLADTVDVTGPPQMVGGVSDHSGQGGAYASQSSGYDLPPNALATAPPSGAVGGLSDLPPTGLPPTDLPPTDLPPTDLPPTDLPSNYAPLTDLPPDLPPTDLPPTDLPPTDLPPAAGSLSDVPPSGAPIVNAPTMGAIGDMNPTDLSPTDLPPTDLPPTDLPPNGPNPAHLSGNMGGQGSVQSGVYDTAGDGGTNPPPTSSGLAPQSQSNYGSPYGSQERSPTPAGGQEIYGMSDLGGDPNAANGDKVIGGPLGVDGANGMDRVARSEGARGISGQGGSNINYNDVPGMVAPASAAQATEVESASVPGDRQLEGQQTPFVAIEKRAPREIRVGQPATFEIIVRNAGQVVAQDVTVVDQVPSGTQFMDATPSPQQLPNGMLVWSFGAVAPGQDRVVSLRLMPQQEGEIGSVAKVICQSQASVRTNCTRPELAVKQTAPEQVLIGDEVEVLIEISNPGTGAADDVILEADVPPGLLHRKGREIDYSIGTLQPNESRTVRLQLAADQAGVVSQSIRARAGNLEKNSSVNIEVIAPSLQMKIFGPAKRYIRREASFELELANPGTATARDIQAVVYLPQGLEFKAASHQGRYQPQNHAVFWRLEELPKGQSGKVQLTALPVAPGEQALRAEGRGNLNTSSSTEHTLAVESLNELVFTISDVNDPIEVGSETTYEIRVTNNGSKTDTNIEVVAQLPEGIRLVDADGPTKHQAEGTVVSFAPLARLAPNGDAVYRLAVQGSTAGDHRVRVQIRSQESPTAVIKEEVTRVYQDR